MAGYEDTKQLIIDALLGRPNGTEIQPEKHQEYAISLLEYIRSIELIIGNSVLIDYANPDTIPVQPNSMASYISSVSQGSTVIFKNFIGYNGQPLTISTEDDEACFVILLWNKQYWDFKKISFRTSITLLQEMGENPNAAMSQYAITKEIERIIGKTVKNKVVDSSGSVVSGQGAYNLILYKIPNNAFALKVNSYVKFPQSDKMLISFFEDEDMATFVSGHTISTITEEDYEYYLLIPNNAKYIAISYTYFDNIYAVSKIIEYYYNDYPFEKTDKEIIFIDNINKKNVLPSSLIEDKVYILTRDITISSAITMNPGSELWIGKHSINATNTNCNIKPISSENKYPVFRYIRQEGVQPIKTLGQFYSPFENRENPTYKIIINDGNEVYIDDFFSDDVEYLQGMNYFFRHIKCNKYYLSKEIKCKFVNSLSGNYGIVEPNTEIIGIGDEAIINLGNTNNRPYPLIINNNCVFKNIKFKTSLSEGNYLTLPLVNILGISDITATFINCRFERLILSTLERSITESDSYISITNNVLKIYESEFIDSYVNLNYSNGSVIDKCKFDSTSTIYDSNSQKIWQRAINIDKCRNCEITNNSIKNKSTAIIFTFLKGANILEKEKDYPNFGLCYNNKILNNEMEQIGAEAIMCDASNFSTKEDSSDYYVDSIDRNTFISSEIIKTNYYPREESSPVENSDTAKGYFVFEDKFGYDYYKKLIIVNQTVGDYYGQYSLIKELINNGDGTFTIRAEKGDFFKNNELGSVYAIMLGFVENEISNNKFRDCFYNTICLYNVCMGNIIENNNYLQNSPRNNDFIFLWTGNRGGRIPVRAFYNNLIKGNCYLDEGESTIKITSRNYGGNILSALNIFSDKFPNSEKDFFGVNIIINNIVSKILDSFDSNNKISKINNYNRNGENSEITSS